MKKRILIVGGGITAVYTANKLLEQTGIYDVLIITKEPYLPYDRIHLCSLIEPGVSLESITLELDSRVQVEVNQEITRIDRDAKRIFSETAVYSYDVLIIATGSKPRTLFDISAIENAVTFRNADDSYTIASGIKEKSVVIVGAGPIGIELLDTLMQVKDARKIYLLSRGAYLYSSDLDPSAIRLIQTIFEQDPRIVISFDDEIISTDIEEKQIKTIRTKKLTIENPFLVFGVGISPNVAFAKESVTVERGVLVDDLMRSSDPFIYAVGEAAQLKLGGFIAGRVKECTLQADAAVADILDKEAIPFSRKVTIDGLKVGSFMFTDISAPTYRPGDDANETIVIASQKEKRIDQYIINNDRLVRFIGINTNIDILHLRQLIERNEAVDAAYFYDNRMISEKGRLVCSCESVYEGELIDLIKENAVITFSDLKPFTEAGRVCGRCKQDVAGLIAATPVDPEEAKRLKAQRMSQEQEEKLALVRRRIEKFNTLHPANQLSSDHLDEAIKSFDMHQEYSGWVSMVTASMGLQSAYETTTKKAIEQLNKIPIIWLELADCSGNSEGFIKSAHPSVDELILDYISLDYHELLMAPSGDQSEAVLESIIANDRGNYILIVEGAVPLGLDGKFLRIGPKGETGLSLLARVAKGAAAVLAVGSCAFDGGVVAAAPNPTGAVGVSEALGRHDIINLPGCPVNPINIVGTLLHYIMFEELPSLDERNRPEWAYGVRVHDNCERRGHYDLEEFVLEWGDEGAKKGWCLFKMGCKGAYSNLNCSLVKFNEGTSWPVQVGHGCFACGEGKIAFDNYANNRMIEEKSDE